jgi:hypothetical protein
MPGTLMDDIEDGHLQKGVRPPVSAFSRLVTGPCRLWRQSHHSIITSPSSYQPSFHSTASSFRQSSASVTPLFDSNKGVAYLPSTCYLQSIITSYHSYSRFQLFCLPCRLHLISLLGLPPRSIPHCLPPIFSSRLISSSRDSFPSSFLCQPFPVSPSSLTTGFTCILTPPILLNSITVLLSNSV